MRMLLATLGVPCPRRRSMGLKREVPPMPEGSLGRGVHGVLTVHVTPVTVFPAGSEASSTVQEKSPAVGGVAPWQSSNWIVKSLPGARASLLATPTRSASSRSLGDENAPCETSRMLCLTL